MTDCPICTRALADDGWCATCLGLTGEEPPPNMRWFVFIDGEEVDFGRLLPVAPVADVYYGPLRSLPYVFNAEKQRYELA